MNQEQQTQVLSPIEYIKQYYLDPKGLTTDDLANLIGDKTSSSPLRKRKGDMYLRLEYCLAIAKVLEIDPYDLIMIDYEYRKSMNNVYQEGITWTYDHYISSDHYSIEEYLKIKANAGGITVSRYIDKLHRREKVIREIEGVLYELSNAREEEGMSVDADEFITFINEEYIDRQFNLYKELTDCIGKLNLKYEITMEENAKLIHLCVTAHSLIEFK